MNKHIVKPQTLYLVKSAISKPQTLNLTLETLDYVPHRIYYFLKPKPYTINPKP